MVVIIPTVDGRAWLPACLAALDRQTYDSFRVLVVENGPGGLVDERVRHRPRVTVRALGQNLGFAAAVNAGIQATVEPLVALLNDDARPDPGWLEWLVRGLDTAYPGDGGAIENVSFVCGKVVAAREPDRIDSVGDGMSRWLLPYPTGRFERDQDRYDIPRIVLLPPGCAVLFRRTFFEDVGLLEPTFFAYLEDVDLGLRAVWRGHRGGYVPGAVAHHVGSATTGSMINAVTVRLSTCNLVRVQLRNLPARGWWRWLPALVAGHGYWFLKMAVKEKHPVAWCVGWFAGFARVAGDLASCRRLMRTRRIDARTFQARLTASALEVQESIRRKRVDGVAKRREA